RKHIRSYTLIVAANVTGTSNNQNQVPKEFSLSQNYPNPFNPSTKIEYGLPVSGHVLISVFDVTGRLIRSLAGKDLQPGFYTENFNADGMSSGVYFYKLEVVNSTGI